MIRRTKATLKRKTILVVEDEEWLLRDYATALRNAGATVLTANSQNSAWAQFRKAKTEIDIALIDMYLPRKQGETEQAGAGTELARRVRAFCSKTPRSHCPLLIGMSFHAPWAQANPVAAGFDRFFSKTDLEFSSDSLPDVVKRLCATHSTALRTLKSFIVHGHDDKTKLELKNFLQNSLGLPEPIILHERADRGRTIIEKFEEEAAEAQVVFVLLTPDDKLGPKRATDEVKARGRQNVILELGYFLGRLARRSGRVILLKRGAIEIPSDIAGLIYVDISNGIAAASEAIRTELVAATTQPRKLSQR